MIPFLAPIVARIVPYKAIIIAGVIAVALVGVSWKSYDLGKESVTAEWNKDKLRIAEEEKAILAYSIKESKVLQSHSDRIQGEKDARIKAINARLSDSLSQLQNRPSRGISAADSSTASESVKGCTGANLLREDAEFLTRDSARSDRINVLLLECQDKYNDVRDRINNPAK